MTLYRQLLIGISLLFLALLAGIQAIYLSNSRRQLEAQLASTAQDAATALALRLAALPDLRDRGMLETLLNPVSDRGYFQEIRVVALDGKTLASRALAAAQGEVPDWFTELFAIVPPTANSLISSEWRELGRVVVQAHPHFAYQRLWHSATQTLAWMLAVYGAAFVLVVAFLRSVLRPLGELEHSAQAIGEREFRTIARLPRARELANVVTAMNAMSDRLQRIMRGEAERAEALRREAFNDPLTGLYNRRGFTHQFHALLKSECDATSSMLAIVEFEKFGDFNARVGYQRGDETIALLARTIVAASEPRGALCARLGGASFAVAALNLDAAAVQQLVEGLCRGIGFVLAEQGLESDLRLHCGATRSDHVLPQLPALLAAADHALASARSRGDGAFAIEVFDQAGEVGSQAWRDRIEEALAQGRFALYAQDVLRLQDGAPAHAEITVRMLREDGEPVPAGQFLPMAARHGQVARLDLHVAGMLLKFLETRDASLPPLALNVSAHTIIDAAARERLLALIASKRELAPRLIVEMSEFGALQDASLSERFSRELRSLGATFALDNFGMRQDSLILVHALKPQYIKLVAGYSRELPASVDSQFLVRAIVRAAEPLDIGVYAQAIEDAALLPLLRDLRLAGYQGYAAAKPLRIV